VTAASTALERLLRVTVRVAGGTGVLVANGINTVVATASHVAAAGGLVRVRARGP
jgi:hypothetical protein